MPARKGKTTSAKNGSSGKKKESGNESENKPAESEETDSIFVNDDTEYEPDADDETEDESEAKDGKNPKKTYEEQLKDAVKHNLETVYGWEPHARTNLAKELYISQAAVSKWTAKKNNSVPSYNYLERIADHFGVSVDWLLTPHVKEQAFRRPDTYAEAFKQLEPFVENEYIDPENIQDEILKYLMKESVRILGDVHISKFAKSEWISDVLRMFNTPIPEHCTPGLTKYIFDHCPDVHSPSELEEYANLARVMSDQDYVQKMKIQYQNLP